MDLPKKIVKEITQNGGRIFYVGGCVRDEILGKESKDIDLEIFYLPLQSVKKILEKHFPIKEVGASFRILLAGNYEFTITDSRENISDAVKNSAARRDFTINSIYKDADTGEIYDYYNGKSDINAKKVRIIDPKNIEKDPLRILRMAQFKARFEFDITTESEETAKKYLPLLANISKERVYEEIKKIMLKSKKPSIAFRWLEKIGYLKMYFPEIAKLRDIEQGEKYHPEGDVFEHTMLALDTIDIEQRDMEIMLAILLHDIGKGEVKTEKIGNNITFHGHASAGEKMTSPILHKITDEVDLIKNVKKLVKHHMSPMQIREDIKRKQIKKLSRKVDFKKLMLVHKADTLGKGGEKKDTSYTDKYIKILEDSTEELKPLLQGKDLIEMGLKPGAYFGEILQKVYDKQLNEEITTKEEAKDYVRNY